MTICKFCNGRGYVYNALGNFYEDCGRCQGTGKVRVEGEPMTEQEYLQTCTTEQLAKAILFFCPSPCEICENPCDDGGACTYNKALNTVVEWLKQPHSEVGK